MDNHNRHCKQCVLGFVFPCSGLMIKRGKILLQHEVSIEKIWQRVQTKIKTVVENQFFSPVQKNILIKNVTFEKLTILP